MFDLRIKKVDNGYSVSYFDNDNEGDIITRIVVFEDVEDDNEIKSEQLTIQKLFYFMLEHFNINNDKHNDQYISIEVTDNE